MRGNMSQNKYRLGLDLGSVSLNCVITDTDNNIVFRKYRRTQGKPIETAIGLFNEITKEFSDATFTGAYVAGSGKELIANPTGIFPVNEIVAHATAAWTFYPEVETVFEIGGQDSKFISIGKSSSGKHYLKDHAFNELCAAGTGAFLDQQAQRLGVTIEELSEMASTAKGVASVAGRCSVFAKSDMIHLQQKAVPQDEIAAGLCFALARNYLASLCRGQNPPSPIIFQGGVAFNKGVIRAFRELLNLKEDELIVPENSDVMGALGCAVLAGQKSLEKELTLNEIVELLEKAPKDGEEDSDLKPLEKIEEVEESKERTTDLKAPFFLGIDVGSVSTKSVVIDSNKNIAASAYVPTAGRPVEAIKNVFEELKKELDVDEITHSVATGSGRHLAGVLLGGATVIDEISAQAISSAYCFPEADTIIEIGGQDSKFIKLKDGRIDSFKMNRVCAAGTGSFLEEQAGRLGISIRKEFAQNAFRSMKPARLGSRCTVFMDSDLVHHLQRGTSTEDLCAGLAYSVGENYVEKVVGSSTFGEKIVFQGGVARNLAVKKVFEELTGKKVHLHPYPEVSGAFGAALKAIEEFQKEEVILNGFKVSALKIEAQTETFECRKCENVCEIRKVTVSDGQIAYFGSVCGRFENMSDKMIAADDAFEVREQLLHENVEKGEIKRGTIGLPYALTMTDYLPFWGTFFNKLGFKTIYSNKTNSKIVDDGQRHVPAEYCFPIKVLFGHVLDLDGKVDRIFIPHLRMTVPPKEKDYRYACPYTQAAPYVIRENLETKSSILTLEYPLDREMDFWLKDVAKELEIDLNEVKAAHEFARNAQKKFENDCLEKGVEILKKLKKENRRGAVLIGRPYNTTDRHVNMNMARKLRSFGIEPIPYDFLPMGDDKLPELWSRIRWGYGRKLVQAARVLKKHDFLGVVIVTNFGCGPDAFVDQYLEYELKHTPNIVIELDAHQAEAGLVTRLEAFSENFRIGDGKNIKVEGRDPGKPRIPLREYVYYIPAFFDHAYALTGALKASGCKTVLLPPTDEESWNLGMKHSYGRECHPFVSFIGDLLKASKRPDFDPKTACYFGPSYFGPCLLPQYPIAAHLILERLGLDDVTVVNITDETNMAELGPAYMIRMALGFYTIDRFFKWKTEILLYEKNKGEVEKVYKEILLDLEEGLEKGSFFKRVKKGVKRLKAIELVKDGTKPKIGIVGDVYTRINEHSNNNLYDKLKNMGYEVWTACSLIDVSFIGMEQLHAKQKREGKPVKSFLTKGLLPAIKMARKLVDRHFPKEIRTPQERNYHAVEKVNKKYSNVWIDKALSLNINRIEELHQNGADGVINVMCHNCMLGTVTASLTKSMRKDMDDLPMCSLVYEGLKSTHNINRLEAFVHQVESFRKK